jgi:hypothetical protein
MRSEFPKKNRPICVREKVFLKNTCKENTWVLGVDSPWDGKKKKLFTIATETIF